jgi:hypothetical protein
MILPSAFISAITEFTQFATSALDGRLVVPWMTPSAIIQLIHCLIKANIHELAKESTSVGDVLHLHLQLLDHLDYQCHHVALVNVQDLDQDDVIRSHRGIQCQHLIDPRYHHGLIHPHGWLTAVEMVGRVNARWKLRPCNAAIWLPLADEHRWE